MYISKKKKKKKIGITTSLEDFTVLEFVGSNFRNSLCYETCLLEGANWDLLGRRPTTSFNRFHMKSNKIVN